MPSCEIDPKEVYAIPGEVGGRLCYKVGFAVEPLERKATHQTSRADVLRFELRCFFINGTQAEKYIKGRLTDLGYHILGENFLAPYEVLKKVFREALFRDQRNWDVVQAAYHRRKLNELTPVDQVEELAAENSAVQFMLSSMVKLNGVASTLQAVILDVFDKGRESRGYKLLTKKGLMPIAGADIILFDKRPGSKLFELFEKGTGDTSWTSHLQGIAGLKKSMELVRMREFLTSPWATPALLGVCVD